MIRIERLFENLFDDKEISVSEITNFSGHYIEKVRANNPGGIYDDMLTDTETKHGDLVKAVSDEKTDESEREGRTKDMDDVVSDFKVSVSRVEGLISYTFGRKSGKYQEFYPQGVTEYNRMGLEQTETLIERFAKAVNKYAADLPAAVPTEFNAHLQDFKDARKEQLKEKAEEKGSEDAIKVAKLALQLQLTGNVLTIAGNNIANPEAAKVYFDQNLLNEAAGQPVSRIKESVDGSSKKPIQYDQELVSNSTVLTFRNFSNKVTLEFYFANVPDAEAGELKVQVGPDSEELITAAEIAFNSTTRILHVKNLDPFAADCEVEVPE